MLYDDPFPAELNPVLEAPGSNVQQHRERLEDQEALAKMFEMSVGQDFETSTMPATGRFVDSRLFPRHRAGRPALVREMARQLRRTAVK
jgi:hypothetical protein